MLRTDDKMINLVFLFIVLAYVVLTKTSFLGKRESSNTFFVFSKQGKRIS